MLNSLPVIVSPTTSRLGFKTTIISKDSLDTVSGDLVRPFKYEIPPVELKKCDESLDLACLLAIGTAPFILQSKQLDGLDKTTNPRTVRFTGVANYTIKPGTISRGAIELIPDIRPITLELETAAVTVRKSLTPTPGDSTDLTFLAQREGTNGAYVFVDGGIVKVGLEGLESTVAKVKVDDRIVKSSLEKQIQVNASVQIDNGLVSPTVNNLVKEGSNVVSALVKIGGGITSDSLESRLSDFASVTIGGGGSVIATSPETTPFTFASIKIDSRQVRSVND
jgi:hypothetical protein